MVFCEALPFSLIEDNTSFREGVGVGDPFLNLPIQTNQGIQNHPIIIITVKSQGSQLSDTGQTDIREKLVLPELLL